MVKYVYKYVHTYICNVHSKNVYMIDTVFIKPSVFWVEDLLSCCFASRIPVGSTTVRLQLQLAKATFCSWIFWGFTDLGMSGRGKRWWLFPLAFPAPVSVFHTSWNTLFFWPWAYINASQNGIAMCGLLPWNKMGATWAGGGGFRNKFFAGESLPYPSIRHYTAIWNYEHRKIQLWNNWN